MYLHCIAYLYDTQLLFWAGNQGNHQNFDPSLLAKRLTDFHGDEAYKYAIQCTEVRFASLLSGGFITAIVANPNLLTFIATTTTTTIKTNN